MSSTALADTSQTSSPSKQAKPIESWRPMLRVVAWELRRFRASRLFWLQALGYFVFSLVMTWVMHSPENFGFGVVAPSSTSASQAERSAPLSGFVGATSARGLLHVLPLFLMVLVLFLPFVTVDGVTRDLQRRTHELILTTSLPSRSYVWGRYLVGLLMSLGLAVLMLLSLFGMGWLLHFTISRYPSPQLGSMLVLWIGIVLSATVLVSSIGFALGTLYPAKSTLIKVAIMAIWIFVAVASFGSGGQKPPSWAMNWDPTSGMTTNGLLNASSLNLGSLGKSITTEAQLQRALVAFENKLPSLAGWYGPHLLLAGLSLLLVLVAGLAFKRSREVLS
ncbi:MAG TPA: ABC transporter permease [Thermomicrobiaceae bacterium]|nr:ABC transporter permease [Thermomicrobiaceae bacterium]